MRKVILITNTSQGRENAEQAGFCMVTGIESLIEYIYGKYSSKFRKEFVEAKKMDIPLYVLVRNDDGIKSLRGLKEWDNPKLSRYNKIVAMHGQGKWGRIPLPQKVPVTGEDLFRKCLVIEQRYGCKFLFCESGEPGKLVLNLLGMEVE